MFPIVNKEEHSFSSMETLREFIASQNRQEYEEPLGQVSLSEDGILCAGGFEGPLTKSGLDGLLRTLGIPLTFGLRDCPPDLLVTMAQRLSEEQHTTVCIQSIDGIANAIMPADRQVITYDMLLEWFDAKQPIQEATVGESLRIITVKDDIGDVLPHDPFGYGWELISSEDGWHSTEIWRVVVRQICTNGMIGFDKAAIFKRNYNSRESILRTLGKLAEVIDHAIKPLELQPAARWATQKLLGKDRPTVVNYLAQRLEGDVTRLALDGITPEGSWYDLLNAVTSLARFHHLTMRRRYEVEGGLLLNWFIRQGRGRPPWQRVSCDTCGYWSNDG